jgi:TetR/AcrR family transcriptional repressor of mexCD-oprJ operon
MPTHPSPRAEPPRRRADAERSIARILDAALDALATDPDASMAEIARRAGVVRATIYMHFPTRDALIDAVTQRAITHVGGVIDAAEPEGGDATDALRRVVTSAWRELGRYHALVAITTQLPHSEVHSKHHPVLARLEPLIARGQRDGSFRADVPAAWHLSMLMALIHAASAELQAARIADTHAEAALVNTVLGAVSARPVAQP